MVRIEAAGGPSSEAGGVGGELRWWRLGIGTEAAQRGGLGVEAAPPSSRGGVGETLPKEETLAGGWRVLVP